jgi:hypothetical protein
VADTLWNIGKVGIPTHIQQREPGPVSESNQGGPGDEDHWCFICSGQSRTQSHRWVDHQRWSRWSLMIINDDRTQSHRWAIINDGSGYEIDVQVGYSTFLLRRMHCFSLNIPRFEAVLYIGRLHLLFTQGGRLRTYFYQLKGDPLEFSLYTPFPGIS